MKVLKITKGWFRSAGNMFRWRDDNYHIFGVGVDMKWIRLPDKEILIELDNVRYTLDLSEARTFISKYSSRYQAGRTVLGVVSRSLLKPIDPPKPEAVAQEKRAEISNQKLF